MKQLNCDFLQITIEFDAKQFKKKEFAKDVRQKNTKETTFLFAFGSKNKKRIEQAQAILNLSGKESVLSIAFRPIKRKEKDKREPYLENAVNWFAQFFTEKEIDVFITTVFKYNQQYESVIQLEYPLLVAGEFLKGATIIGHEIKFPSDSEIKKASISLTDKNFLIFLYSKTKIDLSQFDFHNAVEKFSKYANALIKQKEDKNGKD